MGLNRISPKLLIGVLLALFCLIAFSVRVFLPYDHVFSGEWIKFTSIDAYYQMHLVDNMVHNFPSLTSFDPFFSYLGGGNTGSIHFFNALLAFVIWVIGLGSPTQHTVDVVGVFFPAILATLTVIPVYFIGKALFNRWAGVIAAALFAILPGEYLGRSILGFTDQHVAETLFSTLVVLFLILAIKEGGQRQLTFSHIIHRDWKAFGRPLVYSLLAGAFLGMYLVTWLGALLFVFIISLYFIIQFIVDHLRHKSSDHLVISGVVLFLVAFIIYLPSSPGADFSTVAMVIAIFIPVVLSGISFLISNRKLKAGYYPLALIVIGVIFVAILYAVSPHTIETMVTKFEDVFVPGGSSATTTLEMQPFLSPQGSFSTVVAWGNFTTSFFLVKEWPIPGFGLISFIILIYLFFRQRRDEKHLLLFLVWSLVILVATLVQRRFAYYLVVNMALLSAYLSWQVIWLAGLRKLTIKSEEAPESVRTEPARPKGKKRPEESRSITIYHVNAILAVIAVFFFVFFWNIGKAVEVASQPRYAPSDAWVESLAWMKENTPEPFDDPEAYYQLYESNYKYPESAYAVTSWWDYGYWITRIAHRLPDANPSQFPVPITETANLFLSRDESQAEGIIEELGSSYIITDYDTSTSKFWAVVTWSGQELSEFVSVYYVVQSGQIIPIQVFNTEYYRTLVVRLYNFDGKAVTEVTPTVITYENKTDNKGNKYRQVTDVEQFSSYQEALAYIERKGPENTEIIGVDPLTSPVPLEAVKDYNLVYSSRAGISGRDGSIIPEVKIFEYTGLK
jgi:dolichyl-diphosphooligosaccharide--protein glycosyltransferase